ncbi:MAG: Periplasmic protein TonB [Rhodobacteraceae bacterium HLUCCO07]|nr:MAG: Periplasmic protein TonB [Rhodobacteraceae bacterium HLUCCO07]
MRRYLEGSFFLGVALAVHVAVWSSTPRTGVVGAGEGGDDLLSVQASNAGIEVLVETWDSPPEATMEAETALSEPRDVAMMAPEMPATPDTRAAPAATQPPKPLIVQPDAPALPGYQPPPPAPAPPEPEPSAETPPETDTAPHADIRPVARPVTPPQPQAEPKQNTEKPAKKQSSASAASMARKAQGTGGNAARGDSGQAEVATLSKSQRQSLMAQWGGQIRARVARRAPRGAGRGTAIVTISVSGNGALLAVNLAKSSGNPRIDRLAVAAVRNAGQFPAAPAELGVESHRFNLPVKSR